MLTPAEHGHAAAEGPPPAPMPAAARLPQNAALTALVGKLQDAVVAPQDMTWLSSEGRFVLVASRFRWEAAATGVRPPFERVHTSLQFQHVTGVQRCGPDPHSEPTGQSHFLSLLDIVRDDESILLRFAGGTTLRLLCTNMSCRLADMNEPWPTAWRPSHEPGELPAGSDGRGADD